MGLFDKLFGRTHAAVSSDTSAVAGAVGSLAALYDQGCEAARQQDESLAALPARLGAPRRPPVRAARAG